ncbi:MAG: FAD-dependent oxidoreductase [Pseudomonadota bacterium]
MRPKQHDILFEPVSIGPVTAKNRFYQVPHCTGLGWLRPRMVAHLRGMKAEGGWGAVCTEYCSIHPTSDDLPYPYASLWDQGDIRAHSLMTEQVHAHGALAGVELWAGGSRASNLFTNETAMDVSSRPNATGVPYQTRAMDKSDIRNLRRWHRAAALRARDAGFDIVYVYATHGYLLSNFLSPSQNQRTDEYGGSLENRVRLIRELIEETKEAVGDKCAVAVRFAADTAESTDDNPVLGERGDMFEMLAELPDLWDINVSDYYHEMGVSRFVKEGSLESHMSWVKSVTSKPVVTVGRFTSPDTMASQIRRGVVDLIGAARPSIADPFLPTKIEQGRFDDIRECIGCNICYSGDGTGTPIRCTQNPTISEEWRRGWHPEAIEPKCSDSTVLVIGAGPSGLEAARALGRRGYHVMVADAEKEAGGRVLKESRLPGLSEWVRVINYRLQQLPQMANVDLYQESYMTAEDALETGARHIAVATGAVWRRNGVGLQSSAPIPGLQEAENVFTPDDIMSGRLPGGHVVVYDDDHYYMGSVLALMLRQSGLSVTLVTPASVVSSWGGRTGEQERSHKQMYDDGIDIVVNSEVTAFTGDSAELFDVFTEVVSALPCDSFVNVSSRQPNDSLYYELLSRVESIDENERPSVTRLGDCDAPAIIAGAIFSGHRYARELEMDINPDARIKYDRVFFEEV